MKNPIRKSGARQVGFTLIEAMVVVGLLAIALSLAVPSYTGYVVRTHRTEAIETLLATAACQERLYIRNNVYDADSCEGNSQNDYYAITVTTSNANQNFAAAAAPLGGQVEDSCGTLSITDIGVKTAGDQGGAFARQCWSGRHASAGS
ncbi:MAG: type IV pilin protein [Xanthomonadales bacterium]|nr:type IV pilin protein [Xanthomonadales bacterium]